MTTTVDLEKCRLCDQMEARLQLELLRISCESAGVSPERAVVSISYFVDLLKAAERFDKQFTEVMVTAGRTKKEGLPTAGLANRVQELQDDLRMYTLIARSRIGASK